MTVTLLRVAVVAGAKVNEVDEGTEKSALHVAAENDGNSLVEFLLACGAHLDVIDGCGLTLLYIDRARKPLEVSWRRGGA